MTDYFFQCITQLFYCFLLYCYRHQSAPESRTRSTDYQTKSKTIRSGESSNIQDSDSTSTRASRNQNSATEVNQEQYTPRYESNRDRNVGQANSDPDWRRNPSVRSDSNSGQNGTDTESSCSASTVRDARSFGNTRQNSQTSRHESLSSLDSSVSETKLKDETKLAAASQDKTIDDVLQTHEAKTDNMKNMTRDMGNKMSENMRKGIGREISTDSGIADLVSSTQPSSPVSESSAFSSAAGRELAPRSNVHATSKRDSNTTFQSGNSQKTVKRDDTSIESTDVENASKGIFMTKAEQSCGNIDGVDTVESHQSASAALTATGTASRLRTEVKGGQMTTQAEFEGDSRLARQESSQSTIETDNAKLTKDEDMKQETQSKITETSYTTQGRRGSNESTVSTSKQENTKKESFNKSVNESKISPDGSVSQTSKTEDSKSIASSFSGKSSQQETKGGKTYTRSISSENSSETKTKNVSESKTFSSVSSDGTLVNEPLRANPETRSGENYTRTYDLGTDGLDYNPYARRNSGSSEISRTGSTASSIASSASAMYEREQKKKREQEAAERGRNARYEDHRGSVDSITHAKQVANSKYNMNDSDPLSRQTNVNGSVPQSSNVRQRNNIYQNVPRSESMFSSVSDDVFIEETPVGRRRDLAQEQPKMRERKYDRNSDDFRNRRATLQGDIVLTEREVYKTRDEIRPNLRGKDDSFISSHDESYYSSKDRIPGFNERSGNRGNRSFMDPDVIEREIVSETLSEEDILFGNDDNFFGSSDEFFGRFKSKSNRMGGRRDIDDFFERDSFFNRKPNLRSANPYTTRDDLSKLSSHESLHVNDPKSYRRSKTDSDAMSDSALRSSGNHKPGAGSKSRYDYSDFDDRASVQSLPPQSDSRSRGAYEQLSQRLNVTPEATKSYVQDYVNRNAAPINGSGANRLQVNSSYPSLGVAAEDNRSDYDFKMSSDSGLFSSANASDSIFNAGKSIDRNSDRSIKQNNRIYISSNKAFSDNNLISDNSNRSRRYPNDRCYGEIDMHDDDSARPSTAESRTRIRGSDNVRERGYADNVRGQGNKVSRRHDNKLKGEENAEWDSRRQRIDKALSWIRSELVSTESLFKECLFCDSMRFYITRNNSKVGEERAFKFAAVCPSIGQSVRLFVSLSIL